ncbi:MAG: VOC family protein [Dehalococcoidales bacterium]|nr:VOC family protein [Dehalococcoidales bacterium]
MFTRVKVITCAATNAMETAKYFADTFGLTIKKGGEVPHLNMRNAVLPIDDTMLEFVEPIDAKEKPINNFLKSRGPGVYLLEMEVKSVSAAVERLQKKGVKLIGADPESRKKGAPVFIHPKSAAGILIEITETK